MYVNVSYYSAHFQRLYNWDLRCVVGNGLSDHAIQTAKLQASLHICAVKPEALLFA